MSSSLYSEQEFVDFSFVNVIGTDGLQIELLDFYGSTAGLSGIELFQNDAFTYANNSYNYPGSCKVTGESDMSAQSELNGQFSVPDVSMATYVSTQITNSAEAANVSVVYQPNITVSGNYTVLLFTPGCLQDGTCETRGAVKVTTQSAPDAEPISLTLYETNYYDKYDTIYNGTLEQIDSNWRPSITLQPQLLGDQQYPLTFVADRLKTILVSIQPGLTINNIFEYLPSNYTSNLSNPVGNTTINQAGLLFDKESEVYALAATDDNTIFVGGNITSELLGQNIFRISNTGNGGSFPISGYGLNGVVTSFLGLNGSTLVMGNFTGTTNSSGIITQDIGSLNYVASVGNSDGSLAPLGNGTDGPVSSASLYDLNGTSAISFNGDFTSVRSTNGNFSLAGQLPVWVSDESSWIPDSSFNTSFIQGRVSSSSSFNSTNYYTGFLRVLSSLSSGASFTDAEFNLSPMPFSFVVANTTTNATDSNTLKNEL